MTWERMSRDNFYCAQLLLDREDERLMRSCVARSYYAAYAAACSLVCEPGKTFSTVGTIHRTKTSQACWVRWRD